MTCIRIALAGFVGTILAAAPANGQQPPLPTGAVARLGELRLRVPGYIVDAAFSPDHRKLAVAYSASEPPKASVVFFDVVTGLECGSLPIRGATRIAMARDKPLMAVATDRGVEVWDVAKKERVRKWPYPDALSKISTLAISRDGAQVVAGGRQTEPRAILARWNADNGASLPSLFPAARNVGALTISDDGKRIVSAASFLTDPPDEVSDLEWKLLDYRDNWRNLTVLPGKFGSVAAMGYLVAFRRLPEPTITVWEARSGRKINEIPLNARACVLSPDGTRIARRGDYYGWTEIAEICPGYRSIDWLPLSAVAHAFTPDGKKLILAKADPNPGGRGFPLYDHGVVWDIAARREIRDLGTIGASETQCISQDGRFLAVVASDLACADNHIRILDLTAGKEVEYATGHRGVVNELAYSPDGRWIASCSAGTILIHDAKTGAELKRWVAHDSEIRAIAVSPDAKTIASAAWNGELASWDTQTVKALWRTKLERWGPAAIAFASDGKKLATLARSTVQTTDAATGKTLGSFGLPDTFSGTAIARGRLAFATWESGLHWVNPQAGASMPPISLRSGGFSSCAMAFSSNGKFLATRVSVNKATSGAPAYDHAIHVWESATRTKVASVAGVSSMACTLAVSASGAVLAHGVGGPPDHGHLRDYDFAVVLRDLAAAKDGAPHGGLRELKGHLGHVPCIAFSPDGKFLATGGSDQVIYVWRVADFLEREEVAEPKGDVAALWPALAEKDARSAYRAMAQLERKPSAAVELLRSQLRPVPRADAIVVAELLRDLSSASFTVRGRASKSLEALGESCAHLLVKAAKEAPGLEAKRRVEMLLEKLDRPADDADRLRPGRALTLLERINTPESRRLLEELAGGAPDAWLTQEAQRSLERSGR